MEKVLLLPAIMTIAIISIYTIRISEQDIELLRAVSSVRRAHPTDSDIYLLAVRTLATAFNYGNTTEEYLAMLQSDPQLGPKILSLQQLDDGSFNVIYRENEANRSVWVEVRYYLIQELLEIVKAALDNTLINLAYEENGNPTAQEIMNSIIRVGNNVSIEHLVVKVQVISIPIMPEFADELNTTEILTRISIITNILVTDESTDFSVPFHAIDKIVME